MHKMHRNQDLFSYCKCKQTRAFIMLWMISSSGLEMDLCARNVGKFSRIKDRLSCILRSIGENLLANIVVKITEETNLHQAISTFIHSLTGF